jgi:hypothetical protein
MARGALVDNGVAVRIFEAAEGLNLGLTTQQGKSILQFAATLPP